MYFQISNNPTSNILLANATCTKKKLFQLCSGTCVTDETSKCLRNRDETELSRNINQSLFLISFLKK